MSEHKCQSTLAIEELAKNWEVRIAEIRKLPRHPDYIDGMIDAESRCLTELRESSMNTEARQQAAIEKFRKNWPQVHKAIMSDIMLSEAAEEIQALIELYEEIPRDGSGG